MTIRFLLVFLSLHAAEALAQMKPPTPSTSGVGHDAGR